MTEGIIVALITGVFAVIGSVLGQYWISRKARQEDDIKHAVLNERTDNRLSVIEKKLDVHNGYAEKFAEIQVDLAAIRGEIEILKNK